MTMVMDAGHHIEHRVLPVRRGALRSVAAVGAAIAALQAVLWVGVPQSIGLAMSVGTTLIATAILCDQLSRRLSPVDDAIGLLDAYSHRGAVPGVAHAGIPGLVADVLRNADASRAAAESLQARAIVDESTGLPNRLGSISRLAQTVAQAQRDGVPAFIAVIAVDGIESLPGIDQGVLENTMWVTAHRAIATLRVADWCARWSDHSLLAVFRAPEENAWIVAERLRTAMTVPQTDATAPTVPTVPTVDRRSSGLSQVLIGSVSIGVARLIDVDSSIDDAEFALALAKESGGNQVRMAVPVVELSEQLA
jgi:GGDEF domain-containing protein